MEAKDITYIAGILEGEGHFAFYNTPCIKLDMTDRDIVEKVRSVVYKNAVIRTYQPRQSNWKAQYSLCINGSIAIQWMMTLYLLMGSRRKIQIKEAIDKWKLMIGRGNNNKLSNRKVCKHGHTLQFVSVSKGFDGKVYRHCRECSRLSKKKYKLSKLEKVS